MNSKRSKIYWKLKGSGKFIGIFIELYRLTFTNRYSYNTRTCVLRFVMPTLMHGSAVGWLTDWVPHINMVRELSVRARGVVTLDRFGGDYTGA